MSFLWTLIAFTSMFSPPLLGIYCLIFCDVPSSSNLSSKKSWNTKIINNANECWGKKQKEDQVVPQPWIKKEWMFWRTMPVQCIPRTADFKTFSSQDEKRHVLHVSRTCISQNKNELFLVQREEKHVSWWYKQKYQWKSYIGIHRGPLRNVTSRLCPR